MKYAIRGLIFSLLNLTFLLSANVFAQSILTNQNDSRFDQTVYSILKKQLVDEGIVAVYDNRAKKLIKYIGYRKNNLFIYDSSLLYRKMVPGQLIFPIILNQILSRGDNSVYDSVDLQNGRLKLGNQLIYDGERHSYRSVSICDLIKIRSHVGIVKLTRRAYDTSYGLFKEDLAKSLGHNNYIVKGKSIYDIAQGNSLYLSPYLLLNTYSNLFDNGFIFSRTADSNQSLINCFSINVECTNQDGDYRSEKFIGQFATIKNPSIEGKYVSAFIGALPKENYAYTYLIILDNRRYNPVFYAKEATMPLAKGVLKFFVK